jgi:hypothetical protein
MFSPQNVLAFEPRVRSHIRQLCAQWDLKCKDAANGISGPNWASWNGQATMNICARRSHPYIHADIHRAEPCLQSSRTLRLIPLATLL